MDYKNKILNGRSDISILEGNTTSQNKKVKVVDIEGFEYEVFITTLLKNRPLSMLSAKDKNGLFIHRSKKQNKNFYDYSKTIYIVNSEKVTIICPLHGDFSILPSMHLEGQGCRKCGFKKMSDSIPKNPFRGTKVYFAFYNMKSRCLDKNSKDYKHYGGRGITISKELDTFEKFYNYVRKLPNYDKFINEKYTLDRENNDGHYEKNNLRFVNWQTQLKNRRKFSKSKH